MNKRDREIIDILDRYDISIKEKLFNDLVKNYKILENKKDHSGSVSLKNFEYPSFNYFLKAVFIYLFKMLHKGYKNNALDLISELKTQTLFLDRNDKLKVYELLKEIKDELQNNNEIIN